MSKRGYSNEGKGYFKPSPEDFLMFLDGDFSGYTEKIREKNLKPSLKEKEDALKITEKQSPERK